VAPEPKTGAKRSTHRIAYNQIHNVLHVPNEGTELRDHLDPQRGCREGKRTRAGLDLTRRIHHGRGQEQRIAVVFEVGRERGR
jgi:hypothetical protein